MILLKFLGLCPLDADPAKVDVKEEDLAAIRQELIDAAELLQRGGATITATEWLQMTKAEKVAMKDVGNMLEAERIVHLVNALLSPEYRAELAAPQDGGQALKDIAKAGALEALNVKMNQLGKEYEKRVYLYQ